MAKYNLYSYAEYAKLKGVDVRTIYNWIKDPKVKINVVTVAGRPAIKSNEVFSEKQGA